MSDDAKQWSVKYRPHTLEECLTTTATLSTVKKNIIAGNTSAALISGPSGCGKTTLATIIAHEITGIPYGEPSPDIIEFNLSGVDDVRKLVQRTKFVPNADRRVIIIDECHTLTGQAAQTLLKPLENPSAHTLWLLCTNEPFKLLATLVNRCLPVPLDLPDPDALAALLVKVMKKEKALPDLSKEDRDRLVKAVVLGSSGVPRAALQLLQTAVVALPDYDDVKSFLKGKVLKTPQVDVGKAAVAIYMAAHNKKSRIKEIVSAFAAVDSQLLLDTMLWVGNAAMIELATGQRQSSAYQLFKLAAADKVEINPMVIMKLYQALVTAKLQATSYTVDTKHLLLSALLTIATDA
jgi:replication-associated recombination protein RarA